MPTEMRGSGWRKLVSGGGRTTGAGRVQQRVRRLPARAVVWFVLALTPFGGQGYRSLWRELRRSLDPTTAPRARAATVKNARVRIAPRSISRRVSSKVPARIATSATLGVLRTL